MKKMVITSPVFSHGGYIPKKYTSEGKNVNPPLVVKHIPEQTESVVLIVIDQDAPKEKRHHWIVSNIPPIEEIKENSVPGIEQLNDFTKYSYQGPCPPAGATHRYIFKVYSLDTKLPKYLYDPEYPNLGAENAERALEGHILAKGEILGLYSIDLALG